VTTAPPAAPAVPVTTVPPVLATVPYVVGMARADAVATLQTSGTVAQVLGLGGATPAEAGTVVSQWPPGGREVAVGSTVTVTVRP
jgi:beta-lactam-binding protein with PASTA domain